MRTTMSIDDQLLERAKTHARHAGMTLGEYVEAALRRDLAAGTAERTEVTLTVSAATGGPASGVDLTTNRGIYDAMGTDIA